MSIFHTHPFKKALEQAGHEVFTAPERSKDTLILQLVCEANAVIVTLDRDYYKYVLVDGWKCAGIIWIRPITTKDENLRLNSWAYSLEAKMKEFLLLWEAAYEKGDEKFIGSFISNLQNRIIQIGEQITIIISLIPSNISEKLLSKIKLILTKIYNLGEMQFYIDGGKSESEFNVLGKEVSQEIKDFLQDIRLERYPTLDHFWFD